MAAGWRRWLACSALVGGFALSAQAPQPDLVGSWLGTITTSGKDASFQLRVAKDAGGALEGIANQDTPADGAQVLNLKLSDGKTVTFDIRGLLRTFSELNAAPTLTFRGELNATATEIDGNLYAGFAGPWVGKLVLRRAAAAGVRQAPLIRM